MAYEALIDRNLNKAFKLAKDIAVEASFMLAQKSFDFATMKARDNTSDIVYAKVVPFETTMANEKSGTVRVQLMVKAKPLKELKLYAEVMFNGYTWKIGPVIKGQGAIWVLEVFREA